MPGRPARTRRLRVLTTTCGLFAAVLLLAGSVCPPTAGKSEFDLAAADVCYSVNTSIGEVSVSGVIQNAGTQTVDFGVVHSVPGPNNAYPQGVYVIGANVQGAPHFETQEVKLTDGGLLLKPGESQRSSQSLKLPFDPKNVYSRFEFVVKLKGDQNVSNDSKVILFPPSLTGADLEKQASQHACPQ